MSSPYNAPMRGMGKAVGLLAALWLLATPAGAGAAFDCGGTFHGCQVQVDNGGRVWFWSSELLTEDALGSGRMDRQGVLQVFVRDGETTELMHGPDGEPIPYSPLHRYSEQVNGVSPDGERVYISTEASLTADDHDDPAAGDSALDAYELADGKFTLLTTGPLDQTSTEPFGIVGSRITWASDDGRHVYFVTNSRMTANDLDGSRDVYERSGGTTNLVSTGPAEVLPDANFGERAPDAEFLGASPDGATVYFATYQQLTADDTERGTSDIYASREGVTTRLTHTVKYPEGAGQPFESFFPVSFSGAASDGSIFYIANSPQSPSDTNGYADLYRTYADGRSEPLVGSGGYPPPGTGMFHNPLMTGGVSRDGKRLFFVTSRALLPEDGDDEADVYLLFTEENRLLLVSKGGAEHPDDEPELLFSGLSRDGRRAFFSTWERMTPDDTDDEVDVYEWFNGRDRLATPATDGRQVGSFFQSISPSGRYVVFETFEELVPGDNDAKSDLYLVDMGPESATAAGSAASASARKGRKRGRHAKPRLRLVTAEAIAPRMRVGGSARLGDGGARLRLACPKAEKSGPCRGIARLLARRGGKTLARGSFRVGAGHAASVRLAGTRLEGSPARHGVAIVRGVDSLGNTRTVWAPVRLRGRP